MRLTIDGSRSRTPLRRPASVSLDLDDKWTYMKTHGDPNWQTFPSYLPVVVPRVLNLLREQKLAITFFIVGQDAALEHNRETLRSISAAGHHIGNHSFHHEPWLHLYSRAQLEEEMARAEEAIYNATQVAPVGFRGPGFSVSDTVLDVLVARRYSYDASTLPTFLGPLARAYYFFTAKLTEEQKKERAKLFGNFKDGLRPLHLHTVQRPAGSITELPVTTMPIARTPFHLSYLLYLANLSPKLSAMYLQTAIWLCKWRNVEPSFLLHPLDFAAPNDAPELSFFPAMRLPLETKMEVARMAFDKLAANFELMSMEEHVGLGVERLAQRKAVASDSGLKAEAGS